MNPIEWLKRTLDNRLFSRAVMVYICWFAWRMSDWAMAFAGTVLVMDGQKDFQGAAMLVGAIGVLPVALLTWGLNAYNAMRASQPAGDQRSAA